MSRDPHARAPQGGAAESRSPADPAPEGPAPAGAKRRGGTERRREIVAAAGEMFRERGYHATSMRDLAGRLELRGSSLYAHIEGKEALLAEIVHRAADAFLASAAAVEGTAGAPAQPTGAEVTGAERLRALCRGHLRVVLERLPDAIVFLHEWRFLPPEERVRVVERRDAYQAAFRAAIDAGVRDGSLETDDPALATLFTLSALNGAAPWLRPDGPLEPDALVERYADLAVRALAPRAPRPDDR